MSCSGTTPPPVLHHAAPLHPCSVPVLSGLFWGAEPRNDGVVERLSLGCCAEQREPSLTDWLICSSPRLAIPRRRDTDLSSSEDPIKRLAKRLRGLLIGCNSSSQYNPVVLALCGPGPRRPSHRLVKSPPPASSVQLNCILPIPWRRILISHKS